MHIKDNIIVINLKFLKNFHLINYSNFVLTHKFNYYIVFKKEFSNFFVNLNIHSKYLNASFIKIFKSA